MRWPRRLQPEPSEQQKLRLARITGYNETQMAARRMIVRNGKVLNGIDMLEERQFEPLKIAGVPKPRIGLITNQTGIDAKGRAPSMCWRALRGCSLTPSSLPSTALTGAATTLPTSPTPRTAQPACRSTACTATPTPSGVRLSMSLRNLDVIVFDLQDVGARFYTYEATLGYFLEAAAKAKKPIVVLDRPNPITGAYVQGPVSDAGQESFVNYFPLPVRHGMTMGELAKLFNEEKHIDAELTVIPMRGWLRGDWFDSTGAPGSAPRPTSAIWMRPHSIRASR